MATDLAITRQSVPPRRRRGHVCARVKVSRARALVSFLSAKTLTAANAASQSGLRAAGGWRKNAIERTVPSREYVRWTMFDQIFIGAGSRPGGASRGWRCAPACVGAFPRARDCAHGFRRDWIGVV